MKRKPTLFLVILIPLIIAALTQALLPSAALYLSGVKESMSNSVVESDAQVTENRRVILQNAMLDQWSSIADDADAYTADLDAYLQTHKATIEEFLQSSELQRGYIAKVFNRAVNRVQRDTSCGNFLVIASGQEKESAISKHEGFFVRDSDPQHDPSNRSDLLLERGPKELAHSVNIPLDSPWTSRFSLEDEGSRAADDYYWEPLRAALDNPDVDTSMLGYWSAPFILEDQQVDNHKMITYSVALAYHGTVYGVIGCEASVSELDNYMPVKDLDANLNAGYALVTRNEDGSYNHPIAGTGILYGSISKLQGPIDLEPTDNQSLYLVNGAQTQSGQTFATLSPLDLYSNNVPYDTTNWYLCGLVTGDSIYRLGSGVYQQILATILVCLVFSLVLVVLIAKLVERPIERLMASVRGGIDGIRSFRPSNIREVQELHDVVENLTEAQIEASAKLLEEKERYRVAVKSSTDLFFTYRREEGVLEIVNSIIGIDGDHDLNDPHSALRRYIHPDDLAAFIKEASALPETLELETRIRKQDHGDYDWYRIAGSRANEESGRTVVIGSIRNIQSQKALQLEMERRRELDPLTGFMKLTPALHKIDRVRTSKPAGTMVLLDIEGFSQFAERYGITAADFVLEELARAIKEEGTRHKINDDDVVLGRAGADLLIGWFPNTSASILQSHLSCLEARFKHLVTSDNMHLHFHCALTTANSRKTTEELTVELRRAIACAKQADTTSTIYDKSMAQQAPDKPLAETTSLMSTRDMDLPSFTMSIFDRGKSIEVGMDLLLARLCDYVDIDNVLIVSANPETLTASLNYV